MLQEYGTRKNAMVSRQICFFHNSSLPSVTQKEHASTRCKSHRRQSDYFRSARSCRRGFNPCRFPGLAFYITIPVDLQLHQTHDKPVLVRWIGTGMMMLFLVIWGAENVRCPAVAKGFATFCASFSLYNLRKMHIEPLLYGGSCIVWM